MKLRGSMYVVSRYRKIHKRSVGTKLLSLGKCQPKEWEDKHRGQETKSRKGELSCWPLLKVLKQKLNGSDMQLVSTKDI